MPFVMVLHENYHQYYAIHYNSLILEFTKNGNLFMCTRFEIDAKEPRKTLSLNTRIIYIYKYTEQKVRMASS